MFLCVCCAGMPGVARVVVAMVVLVAIGTQVLSASATDQGPSWKATAAAMQRSAFEETIIRFVGVGRVRPWVTPHALHS